MPGRPSLPSISALLALAVAGSTGVHPSPARAQPTAELLDYGIMTGRRAPLPEPGSPGPGLGPGGTGLTPAVPMSHQRYLERTDAIEARLCRSFGLHLRVLPGPGEPEPSIVMVHVLHPTFTTAEGATSAEDDFPSAVVFGQTHAGFTFDHAWELQPGDWTFVITAGRAVIAKRRFRVTLPPPGAATSDCDGATS